jgi:hypothetical protein
MNAYIENIMVYSIVGSPELFFTLGACLGIGGVWPLSVLMAWILGSLCHEIILIPLWWVLMYVGLLVDPEYFCDACMLVVFKEKTSFLYKKIQDDFS